MGNYYVSLCDFLIINSICLIKSWLFDKWVSSKLSINEPLQHSRFDTNSRNTLLNTISSSTFFNEASLLHKLLSHCSDLVDQATFSWPRRTFYVVNWTSYNESLVRRGEVILDFDIIDGWHAELERMNEGKRGAAYGYPDLFVLGYVKLYFHLPYRQTEEVVRVHAANKIPSIPDYSTIILAYRSYYYWPMTHLLYLHNRARHSR